MLHFTIGSSLVSHFTHRLGIHWFIALELPIGYIYPLEIQLWISLDWNHHHWINSRTQNIDHFTLDRTFIAHWLN